MKSVDTNILIRFLTKDDEQQYEKSYNVLNAHQIFIADTVILETEWVLRFAYKFSSAEIYSALSKLFGLPHIYLNQPTLVYQALQWYHSGLDFADAMHLANSQHCEDFFTFDKAFAKQSQGLTHCQVISP